MKFILKTNNRFFQWLKILKVIKFFFFKNSPWFAAPGIFLYFLFFYKKIIVFSGSPYIPPPSFTSGNFSMDQGYFILIFYYSFLDLWKATPSTNTFQQWSNSPIYDFGNSNLISDLIEDSKFAIEQTKLALEQSKLCRQMVWNFFGIFYFLIENGVTQLF